MRTNLEVCFVGDSFVAGIGDPEYRGWVGRITARTRNRRLTAHNLGARAWTSKDVADRWRGECAARLRDGNDCRIVASFGTNDATLLGGSPRVGLADSVGNLSRLLTEAEASGWAVLVVGPPPTTDTNQNQRIRDLNHEYEQHCRKTGVGYVDVFERLVTSTIWMQEIRSGDGAHPAETGYERLADFIWPQWIAWIGVE